MKQIYKVLMLVFTVLILVSALATANAKENMKGTVAMIKPDPYEDCRSCHSTGATDRHHYFFIIGKYSACEICHPLINGSVVIERDCKNCHNGTAFWANPDLNPGAPLHIPVSITITSPISGEIWARGTTQTIKWSYTGNPGPNVTIVLLKNGAIYQTVISSIFTGINGSGSYSWIIPQSIEIGNDYQIRIKSMVSTTNITYTDTSDNFAIQNKRKQR